jgi:hypothetical protein
MAGGVVMGAAAAAAAQRRERMATADKVWAPYAEARGMRYQPGRQGWAHVEWPRIDGAVGTTAVALELFEDGLDVNPFWAVALARPAVPRKGHVEVSREGLFSRIAKVFGAQDIVIGDEVFDRAYVVKATDEGSARALLTPSVTSEMLAIGAKYLAYDDGTENGYGALVVAHVPFAAVSSEIDRALAFVTEMARTRGDQGAYR